MRLIPAIDIKSGQCVRLLRGQFDHETVYATDPQTILDKYRAFGADWLHVVDLDGARDGEFGNRNAIIALTKAAGVSVQVGGGIRTHAAARQMLDAGVARLVVGSAALTHPELVADWLLQHGAERVALAIDVRIASGLPMVATHGWQRQSDQTLWQVVEDFLAAGLLHVLCTDIDRDGALAGPNLALYAEARQRFPGIQWQASGGIRNVADLEQLAALGMSAAVSGKALLEERMTLEELRPFLPNA